MGQQVGPQQRAVTVARLVERREAGSLTAEHHVLTEGAGIPSAFLIRGL
ncbi:MAG TPA: hypothetical protein VNV66_08970 [Pilimelia sp.]|nr:hypothetical protein [Pilimelia sp.]